MPVGKKDYVKSVFKRRTGSPLIDDELSDEDFDSALIDACHRFYVARPIAKHAQTSVSAGENQVNVSTIAGNLFDDSSRYYFIGLLRADYILEGEGINSNYESILSGAGGINVGTSAPAHVYGSHGTIGGVSLWEPTGSLQQASVRDQVIADLEIEYNEIEGEITYRVPVSGSVTASYGFGYKGTIGQSGVAEANRTYPWDGIPYAYLQTIAGLTMEELLTAILSGRAAVDITASATLNTSVLESIRSEVREENTEALTNISTPITFYG